MYSGPTVSVRPHPAVLVTDLYGRAVSRLADGNRLAKRKNRLASRLKLGMGLPDPNIRYCTKNVYFANITILY